MWARRFPAASARWFLASWVVAWSMLITQPCCYADAAHLIAERGQQTEWGHAHPSPKHNTDQDHCDEVVSGALTAVATNSTSAFGTELPPLPLSPPAFLLPASGKLQLISLPVPRNATPPPRRQALYLATARLRI